MTGPARSRSCTSRIWTITPALDDLKAELETRKDPGRVKRLLRTLALFGDIEGSIGLMVRLWPPVGTAAALAHGLGIQ